MKTIAVHLPESLYELVSERAASRDETPDHFVAELLTQHLLPIHPYVEAISSRSGLRAVIKDTRIGVDVIVGYTNAGYTPLEIVGEILPNLTLAQVYDALSYYEDHRVVMDEVVQANEPKIWRERLHREMGATAAARLLGE